MDIFGEAARAPGQVLVVDDSMITTESMRQALQGSFTVETVDSGEACLERLAAGGKLPDLILLDIEMGGIDGFETCSALRAADHDIPVIFVSSHNELPDLIKAFDSGGDDFVVKPFDPELILLKALRIVSHHSAKKKLSIEAESLKNMTMGLIGDIGYGDVLLNFMRGGLDVTDYDLLAQRVFEATANYNVRCHVQVRHADGVCTITPTGKASPLEESVLEKSANMGRIFQFSRRLVVNYSAVSILIIDLPTDPTKKGRLRDYITILAETAQAIAETIDMRKESAQRAEALQAAVGETADAVETLRELYRKQQSDAHICLNDMIENVEKAYVNLGLTDNQEARVSNIVRAGAGNTLILFDIGVEVDKRFAQILDALRPQGANSVQSELW